MVERKKEFFRVRIASLFMSHYYIVRLCCVIYCQSIDQFYCSNYIQRRLSALLTQSFFVCIASERKNTNSKQCRRRRRLTADKYRHTLIVIPIHTATHMHYIFKLISHEIMFGVNRILCSGAYGYNIF